MSFSRKIEKANIEWHLTRGDLLLKPPSSGYGNYQPQTSRGSLLGLGCFSALNIVQQKDQSWQYCWLQEDTLPHPNGVNLGAQCRAKEQEKVKRRQHYHLYSNRSQSKNHKEYHLNQPNNNRNSDILPLQITTSTQASNDGNQMCFNHNPIKFKAAQFKILPCKGEEVIGVNNHCTELNKCT